MEKPTKRRGIYMLSVLNRRVVLPFRSVGNNISELLVENLVNQYEGKCVKEGFIKKNSVRILNFSAGKCSGTNVLFNVSFECLVCCPIEGMNMKVVVKNVTKAGLKCEVKGDNSPIIAFIARDHHFKNKDFSKIKVDDDILIKVVGTRFELNDTYISLIGELLNKKPKIQTRIMIKGKKS